MTDTVLLLLQETIQLAESCKDRGNQEYSKQNYKEAISSYSKGVVAIGEYLQQHVGGGGGVVVDGEKEDENMTRLKKLASQLYCNRAVSWLNAPAQLKNYQEALDDAKKSISFDDTFAKAYLRMAESLIGLDCYKEAKDAYLQCIRRIAVDPNDKTANAHNTLLTQATNGLNNSKMKMFYEPILTEKPDHYGKIELRYTDEIRRKSLFARCDVKKGDVVFTDTDLYANIKSPSLDINTYQRLFCDHCMGQLPKVSETETAEKVVLCKYGCTRIMIGSNTVDTTKYCSEKCRDDAWDEYHCQECGSMSQPQAGELDVVSRVHGITEYRKMVHGVPTEASLLLAERIIAIISTKLKKGHVKNCNLALGKLQHLRRDPLMQIQKSFNGNNLEELQNQYKPLLAFLKQSYGIKLTSLDTIQYKSDNKILIEELEKLFSNKFYDEILGLINYNSISTFVYGEETVINTGAKNKKMQPKLRQYCLGSALIPIFACLNHSCAPNIEMGREQRDGVTKAIAVMIAKQDIKKGQELLTSYIDESNPFKDRQSILSSQYGFTCNCNKCSKRR
ncbi:hypothetical protein DFA_12294 [Cavenderia fasciculata]|uniref:SET domain-containing protein n=1 Tax=Cavenderia fasciculata TaxID=261658 RepID=F4QD47_CACFS|nr:uncharacterized protein DFA_12294 [Cavenderia fasciculata]EGG14518.1 hypothetical protein DFA_12294 [Cavenderia fasciculata]|eukprot:XP_004353939.1 hypothetical protein DFA_12294 [Cavenderia fasciculata]